MTSTISTWKYLRYVAGASHYMTEVIADLETELKAQGIEVRNTLDPGEPPVEPRGGGFCIPPDRCKMTVSELFEYADQLRGYFDKVMQLTSEHVALSREKGVIEFPFRVIARPEKPM